MDDVVAANTNLEGTATPHPAIVVDRGLWALSLAFIASLLILARAVDVSPSAWGVSILSAAAMMTAGVLCLRWALPSESPVDTLICGSVFGLTAGKYVLFGLGLLVGLNAATVVLWIGLMLGVAAASLYGSRGATVARWDDDSTREVRVLLILLVATFVFISIPYSRMGGLTPRGFSFVPYFGKDLFQHISITAELSRSVPPQNPYFAGTTLHYYWFSHLWPAAVMSLSGGAAREALLATLPINVTLFVGALLVLLRGRGSERTARAAAVGVALFAPGYIGLLYGLTSIVPPVLSLVPTYSHIGFSFLSHSWLRDCLYEPHAISALGLVIATVHVVSSSGHRPTWTAGLFAGMGLAAAVMTDAFIGLLGTAWWALAALRSVLRDRRSWSLAAGAAITGVAVLVVALRVGIFPAAGVPMLRIAPHPLASLAPLVLLADLGPLLLLGGLGLWIAYRQRALAPGDPVVMLGAVVVVAAFAVRVPLDDDIFLRKSVKVLQIPLVVFSAWAFSIWHGRRYGSWVKWSLSVAVALGAVTVLTDLIQYSRLTGPRMPPASYVEVGEMEALNWIRQNTPREAVFQDVAEVRPGLRYRDSGESVITALGERRTLFGNYESPYTFRVPPAIIEARLTLLERLGAPHDIGEIQQVLRRMGPCYLLVNAARKGPVKELQTLVRAGVLVEVFRAGNVSVIRN